MPLPLSGPGNLPAETTSFIGRRHEQAETRRKLTGARLVTLVGPGGVGKTRLALRVASALSRGFPDGTWLVELAELRDPAMIPNAVLAALDLRDQAAAEPAALLHSYVKERQLLLVLDNCEHLLPATARFTSSILKASPGIRIIATSREPLSMTGEHVLPVPPLPLPPVHGGEPLAVLHQNEAVRLFAERAEAATGGFALTAVNKEAVVEICRRLDGLPLAIELAAARTRALTPEQIRDRLGRRFEILTGGNRAALPRHQTLRTTIEWSFDLLAPAERMLFSRLSVFAGRFLLEDVEAVCCSDDLPAALTWDLLSSLLEKSLLIKEDSTGTSSYRMHESVREYARLRLSAAGEEAAVERHCADYFLLRCRQFAAEGRYRLLEWLAWTDLEIDNIRSVIQKLIDRGDHTRGLEIAGSLIWYWITRGTTEGVRRLDQLLAQHPGPIADPWVYFARGYLAVLQNDPAAAVPTLALGTAAARAAGQPAALSQSLAMASIAANMAGEQASSRQLAAEARAVADGLADLGAALMIHQSQALNGFIDGDLRTVHSAASAGVRLSREAGDLYSLGMMLMNLGFADLMSEHLRAAEQSFFEGLGIAAELDDRVAQCYLLGGLGCCAARTNEPRLAAQLLGAMEQLRTEVGARLNAGMAPVLADATTTVTAALGPSKFMAEFETGKQLSREASICLGLRQNPSAASVVPDQSAPGVLSHRETEVARLVAGGLGNKEIGGRLFISERTVESHVRNILIKLGFTSRTQIAGWISASDA